jgi:hypothetical protein
MKNIIIVCIALLGFTQVGVAQTNRFEKRAAEIAHKIDSITTAEKSALKKELKKIDKKLEANELSPEAASIEKKRLSELYAEKINTAVSIEEQKLQMLIKNKVNGNLAVTEEKDKKVFFSTFTGDNYYQDSITGLKVEKRWTTQFIMALGANTFSGGANALKSNVFGYGEVGFSYKYRFKEDSNLWNLKLGFSTMIDEITPEADNDIFVTDGNQTLLVNSGLNLRRSYLSNVYVGIPVHLELDFSKPEYNKDTKQSYLRSQRGFRLGVGGFAALRISTRQFIRYNDEDGKRISINQRDNFNVNDFIFGPSAYIGYRDISLYFKYNANSLFRNNIDDVNSLAIALRFDFN